MVKLLFILKEYLCKNKKYITAMFVEKAVERLKLKYKSVYDCAVISDVRIGPFLCGVRTAGGFCGVSGIGEGISKICSHREKVFGDFTPGEYRGRKISALLEFTGKNPHLHVLKIAALNALTAEILTQEHYDKNYRIIPSKDPVELLDVNPSKKVCIVGAFQSYMRRFEREAVPFTVLELEKGVFTEEDLKYYRPSQMAHEIIPDADVVIITASAIENHTLQGLLSHIRKGCIVALAGPTGGFMPELFFEAGVNIIGCLRVNNPDSVMDAISEGAFAYHLFTIGAEKICIVDETVRS